MSDIARRFEREIAELAAASRRLGRLGYVSSHGGNLSSRVAEDVVLITPTKVPKRLIRPSDICIVDTSGAPLHCPSGRKPTGETPMHLGLFRKRPDANAIVHAHPPILTGFACSGRAQLLARPVLPEPAIELGPAALVEYAEPLTEDLAREFEPWLARHDFFLMRNHGALVLSREGVARAVDLLVMLEKQALSVLVAELLGGARELSREDVAGLDRTLRTRRLPFPGASGAVKSLVELFFPSG